MQNNQGHRLWLRTTKVPLRGEDGSVIGLFGCYEDITERYEALRALRESEERFRTLFEQAQDGIFVIDKNGFISSANSAGQRMVGYTEEELKKKRVTELIDPLDRRELPFRAVRCRWASASSCHAICAARTANWWQRR